MPQPPVDPSAVRTWAREQGIQVADRGRLPAAVLEGYLAAHPSRTSRSRKAAASVPRQPVQRDVVPEPEEAAAPDQAAAPEPVAPASSAAPAASEELGRLRAELAELREQQEELLRRVGTLEAGRRRMFRRP